MPNNKSTNDYINDGDLYLLYRKIYSSGNWEKGSALWKRMQVVLNRMTKKFMGKEVRNNKYE